MDKDSKGGRECYGRATGPKVDGLSFPPSASPTAVEWQQSQSLKMGPAVDSEQESREYQKYQGNPKYLHHYQVRTRGVSGHGCNSLVRARLISSKDGGGEGFHPVRSSMEPLWECVVASSIAITSKVPPASDMPWAVTNGRGALLM